MATKHERQIETLFESPSEQSIGTPASLSLSLLLTALRLLPIDEEDIYVALSNDQLEDIQRFQNKGHDHEGGECRLLSAGGSDEIHEIISLRRDTAVKKENEEVLRYFEEDQPPHGNPGHDDEEDRGDDVAQTEE